VAWYRREVTIRFAVVCLLAACGSHSVPVGELVGGVDVTDEVTRIHYEGRDVPVEKIAAAQQWGLPVSGTATVAIAVDVPRVNAVDDYSRATGTIRVICKACKVGDDVAKLTSPLGAIDFGHIAVPDFELAIDVANGKAVVSTWRFDSPDVVLEVALELELARRFDDSTVNGCIRFHPTGGLMQHAPTTAAALQATGADMHADGNFQIKLSGKVRDPRRLNAECGDSAPRTLRHP